MFTKKKVLKSFQTLPSKFNAEKAIEKIIMLEKVHIGFEQSSAGKMQSKEEAIRRLNKQSETLE